MLGNIYACLWSHVIYHVLCIVVYMHVFECICTTEVHAAEKPANSAAEARRESKKMRVVRMMRRTSLDSLIAIRRASVATWESSGSR